MRTLVVIPTYNELESLPVTLAGIREHAPQAHVLVVDDSSPDGTGQKADELSAADENIHVLHRMEKNGLGPAYLAGFQWGMDQGFELLVEMDADGSHRAQDLALLLQRAEMADAPDLVIGSRWVSGGATQGWDSKRVLLSRAGNFYAGAMLGTRVKDATAGFRVYRTDLLRRIDFSTVEALGYGFQVNMTKIVEELCGRIVEMPITFVERTAGESKLDQGIFWEELSLVTRWGLNKRGEQLTTVTQQVVGEIVETVNAEMKKRRQS